MRNLIIILVLIMSAGVAFSAQTGGNAFDSDITGATVYLKGAEIRGTSKVKLKAGENEVVITGISSGIDPNSIRLTSNTTGIINSVRHNINYLKNDEDERFIELRDSIDILNEDKVLLQSEKFILNEEVKILTSNLTLKQNESIPTAAATKSYIDFYRDRRMAVSRRNVKIDREIVLLNEKISNYQSEISKYKGSEPQHQIIVEFDAERSGNAKFNFAYNISNAGWQPTYDLYVSDKKTELIYKGGIYQRSGIDWDNINLVLSTTRPSYNNQAPNYRRMYVDAFEERDFGRSKSYSKSILQSRELSSADEDVSGLVDNALAPSSATNRTFNQIDNGLDILYEVPKKYSIKSDGNRKTVTLQAREIDSELRYISIPSQSEKAFLIADLDKSLGSELVSGNVSVFYNGGYTGVSYLNMQSSDDKISVTITADDRIKVKRRLLRDFQEDKFLSSDIEKYFAYETTIENNKNKPVEIEILESLPIAQSERVEVELLEKGGAELDPKTNKLTWQLNIDKQGKQTIKYVYSLRYPKDMRINTTYRD